MAEKREGHKVSTAGLVNAKELASLLGLPVSWVYRAADRGRIPVYRLGMYLKFNPDEVLRACREPMRNEGGGGER